jgi:hypothetical protein
METALVPQDLHMQSGRINSLLNADIRHDRLDRRMVILTNY